MGKRLPSPASIEYYGRSAAERIQRAKATKKSAAAASAVVVRQLASNKEEASASNSAAGGRVRSMERVEDRLPLKEVVEDCVKRWFQDALKEARAGDTAMQVLVGQMYHSGYGIAKNDQKANAWITKASKYRSAVWKVSEKRPGYNASDSDSDEDNDNLKSRSDAV